MREFTKNIHTQFCTGAQTVGFCGVLACLSITGWRLWASDRAACGASERKEGARAPVAASDRENDTIGGDLPVERRLEEFVLNEVRRRLEPNPETDVIELKFDPDYRGPKDTWLVNAVIDHHGRRLCVGVMVSVEQTSRGMRANLGFVD